MNIHIVEKVREDGVVEALGYADEHSVAGNIFLYQRSVYQEDESYVILNESLDVDNYYLEVKRDGYKYKISIRQQEVSTNKPKS